MMWINMNIGMLAAAGWEIKIDESVLTDFEPVSVSALQAPAVRHLTIEKGGRVAMKFVLREFVVDGEAIMDLTQDLATLEAKLARGGAEELTR